MQPSGAGDGLVAQLLRLREGQVLDLGFESPTPPTSTVIPAIPNSRATSGWTTSTPAVGTVGGAVPDGSAHPRPAEGPLVVEPERESLPRQELEGARDHRDEDGHDDHPNAPARTGTWATNCPRAATPMTIATGNIRTRVHDGGDGMSPARFGGTRASGSHRPRRGRKAHSPADRASPAAARRSRRWAATSGVRPGIPASVVAAAVCSFTVASPATGRSGRRPDRPTASGRRGR